MAIVIFKGTVEAWTGAWTNLFTWTKMSSWGMTDDPRKVFGATVRKDRMALKWSQEELAEAAGLHLTYIGGIERSERNISLLNIVKVSQALKLTVSSLGKGLG